MTAAAPPPIITSTEDLAAAAADVQSLSSNRSISSTLSFKEKMYGLLSPTSTDVSCDHLSEEEYRAKVTAIQDCLRGNSKDQIDLWQLRELALSPGGLLEPSLRKRAWPLLTACVANKNNSTSTKKGTTSSSAGGVITLSNADLAALQAEVPHTVWNVQEHFVQQQQLVKAHSDNHGRSFKKVSFAPPTKGMAVPGTATVEEAKEGDDHDDNENELICKEQVDDDSRSSLWSHGSCSIDSRRWRGRNAGKLEQKIVANAVTSCLRLRAPESEAFQDDRFHYFTGLHDLTALLMINLESPSLGSLVL